MRSFDLSTYAPRLPVGFGCLVCLPMVLALGGCASSRFAELRPVPRSPLVERLKMTATDGPKPSSRTEQFLRVYDLTDLQGNPQKLLQRVQEIIEQEPTPENIYAFAELSYIAGKKAEPFEPKLALDLYGASVLHAYQYLFDDRFRYLRNPYDPQFRGACDLYNGALEAGLRIVCRDGGLVPGQNLTISTAAGCWDISCEIRGGPWRADEFDRFEFASDWEIRGLKNQYHAYGLGVPLIAVRRSHAGESVATKYYAPNLSFPVTAFVRPMPGSNPHCADAHARHRAVLEIYDPLTTTDVALGNLRVPLESDLSTPLAYFLSHPQLDFRNLAWTGLLRPEVLLSMRPGRPGPIMGLYMAQPYEPGKIPVVMVHGLWSSPMTWMQMFNDLRASPAIRRNYQFWFYLYPTGQPFWVSAAQLRRDLAEAREVLDPCRREPALDEMVLIGHSMGGLVSRLQTIESRDDFWRLVSDQPFRLIKADPDVRRQLEDSFFFRPNPSIRRVITIGTPHRGSHFSNVTTQWLLGQLIRLPRMLIRTQEALFRDNKHLIRDDSLLEIENSVDSLDPDSRFFPVMLASYKAPWVRYHNVIGLVPERGLWGRLAAGSDGVVSRESASVDDAESEIVLEAEHSSVHTHPRAVLEVKRILLKHLGELPALPNYGPLQARSAAARSAVR
jgi:pimeloyl-ACP methyl ester carboxylesterase